MDSSARPADEALAELLEVSPQVESAVLVNRANASLIAAAPAAMTSTGTQFAEVAMQLLDAGEQARAELGREPLVQVEVATPEGHVFVLADEQRVIAAVTSSDPTVGLVFYDLKTALRVLRENDAAAASAGSSDDVATSSDAASDASDQTATNGTTIKVGRWRKRNVQ